MRFLLVVLIWIVFAGGLWTYTSQRDASLPQGPSMAAAPQVISGNYVLEITPGFTIEKDPFALVLDDDAPDAQGLEVRLNGRVLGVQSEKIQRGRVIRITKDLTFTSGFNEFYVKASPPMAEADLEHGLRVRLLDNGVPVVDRTLWGRSGAVVAGTVDFNLAAAKKDIHEH